ncbi:carboxypeptidase-like regulatory domain-containing protein [Marinilabilia rubra]|uniref:carboxypeptidase-like regulatory domain-containing protein n=1 Tax=Marinilabilia rubra TaxID=2162893 RepID=UPI0018E09965|nr:carboxypeptidase-like regulatory domain-containing protein [Marinilabilia rubra]
MWERVYRKLLPVVVGLLVVTGCAREVYNISWKGIVADKTTGRPVPHARIIATASYQENIDETSDFNKYAVSDEFGRFSIDFPQGFGLTVRTDARGYLGALDYKVVKKSVLFDTIFVSPYPFDASLVVRKMNGNSFSPSIPFIRESQVLEGERGVSREKISWGYDFLYGINTSNLDSADVWVEINKTNKRIVLNAADGGGIFPVVKSDSENFLTSLTRAPQSGYVKTHVLKGDEAGFFILCRNGINVAKMIPENRVCVLKYKNDDGNQVKETGIRFDYLFQPDLKNRLYFPVSASAAESNNKTEKGGPSSESFEVQF